MGNYRSLKIRRKAHHLTLRVYEVTAGFPAAERFGLTSQLRRAAASVPANIAEGCGRNTDAELARFCRIALGSANELDYHLLLAHDLRLLPEQDHQALYGQVDQLKRMLAAFVAGLHADTS